MNPFAGMRVSLGRGIRVVWGILAGSVLPQALSAASLGGEPLQPREGRLPARLFERLSAAATDIDFHLQFPPDAPFDLLTDQTSGAGVAIGDADGDGLPDIFVTRYDLGNRLYRNLGGWRFEDVSERAGVSGMGAWCGGAAFADIDNDGDLDLYVCAYDAPNLLYLNRGDGRFDERAAAFGLDYSGASVMMAFADYDRDGDLDGYLTTHRLKKGGRHLLPKSTREAVERGILEIGQGRAAVRPEYSELFALMDKGGGRRELIIAGQQDVLFRNEGAGQFRAVNEEAGIRGAGIGLAAAWWDYNDDGWPDLYVSNDYKGADQLYRNNGDGTFAESARTALPHIPWFSMGSDSADINNDGRMDFLASDMSGSSHFSQKMGMGNMAKNRWFLLRSNPRQYMRNAVFVATGTERLWEAAALTGLANTDWTWSPKFGDFDLDGRVDLFVSNGMSRDFMNSDLAAAVRAREDWKWRTTPILEQPNLAFRNLGGLSFQSVGAAWGLDQKAASYGAALADLDRDGDLDLAVVDFGQALSLYRNNGTAGAGLLIRLVGQASNRWGIGAKVAAQAGSLTVARVLTAAQGFMSANEPLVHLGFPEARAIDRLEVRWPSGVQQTFHDVQPGQLLKIREAGAVPPSRSPKKETPWFVERTPKWNWKHRERPFDDYLQQPLLPSRQSRLGPGMAAGDVDGDGDEDLFLGGAAGQSGSLALKQPAGWNLITAPFAPDTESEDMGALFFDADSDGDPDLYVVSGGAESKPGSERLKDRLYRNDGRGNFQKTAGVLPGLAVSGSVVSASDFDRDGDLDLFVGGRSTPGRYPLAEPNQLLRNDGGRFAAVADRLASGLRHSGLVTAAIWSDIDSDGWNDLLVAHEWGAIRVFRNRQGRLADETEASGLASRLGWWNGIVSGDFDRDGDMDYLASNRGRNTKYHGNSRHPCVLYYGDVDGSGVPHIVEAKFEGDVCYPERGRSCSAAAMPSLAGRFPTFRKFALASLSEIYPKPQLAGALKLEVNTLDSVLLRNDGSGRFAVEPLPPLAQIAPGFGLAAGEFDGDGWLDCVLAQNDFSPQPETGRMGGGQSLALQGGTGRLPEAVWPAASGLSVTGDAKSAVCSDANQDGLPDVWIAQNNGPVKLFLNQNALRNRFLAVRLQGRTGNPNAVGARVTVHCKDAKPQTQEVNAGAGYLSQSTPALFFGMGANAELKAVEIRWPDGSHSRHARLPAAGGTLQIAQPK